MKAIYDGADYVIMLRPGEMDSLKNNSLEASLLGRDGDDLGKLLSLTCVANSEPEGILLEYLPKGADDWEDFTGIHIQLNPSAYARLQQHQHVNARYNGSDKVEIFDGHPR